MSYKIICSQPKKGIERSLPYVLTDKSEAIVLAGNLDGLMKAKGYIHRVEPAEAQSVRTKNAIGGRRSVK